MYQNRTSYSYKTRHSRRNKSPNVDYNVRNAPVITRNEYEQLEDLMVNDFGFGSRQKLTPGYIANILASADTGYSRSQAAMISMIQDRDAVISSHLQTRRLAVAGIPWSIIGGDEEKRKDMENSLRNSGLDDLKLKLLEAVSYGYAGAKTVWGSGGGKIIKFIPVAAENWEFDNAGNPALAVNGTVTGLNEYPLYSYVFHTPKIKSGIPSQRSVIRPLTWIYLFKNYAIKFKTRFLEKFGIPLIIEKVSDSDFNDATVRAALKAELQAIGTNGVGLTTKNSDVQFATAGASGNNANFIEWINKLDEYCALTILGQIASSGPTGGFSEGQIQQQVKDEIITADALALQVTLDQQIRRPLEYFKYETNEMTLKLDLEPPEDVKQLIENAKSVDEMGYVIEESFFEKLGVPLKKDKDGNFIRKNQKSNQIVSPGAVDLLGDTSPVLSPNDTDTSPGSPGKSTAPAPMSDMSLKKKHGAMSFADTATVEKLLNSVNLPDAIWERLGKAESLEDLHGRIAREVGAIVVKGDDSEEIFGVIDSLQKLSQSAEIAVVQERNSQEEADESAGEQDEETQRMVSVITEPSQEDVARMAEAKKAVLATEEERLAEQRDGIIDQYGKELVSPEGISDETREQEKNYLDNVKRYQNAIEDTESFSQNEINYFQGKRKKEVIDDLKNLNSKISENVFAQMASNPVSNRLTNKDADTIAESIAITTPDTIATKNHIRRQIQQQNKSMEEKHGKTLSLAKEYFTKHLKNSDRDELVSVASQVKELPDPEQNTFFMALKALYDGHKDFYEKQSGDKSISEDIKEGWGDVVESIERTFNKPLEGQKNINKSFLAIEKDNLEYLIERNINTEKNKKELEKVEKLLKSHDALDLNDRVEAAANQLKQESEANLPEDYLSTMFHQAVRTGVPMGVGMAMNLVPIVGQGASFMMWQNMSYDSMKQNLLAKGVDPDTASQLAFVASIPSAAAEYMVMDKLTPDVIKRLGDITSEAVSNGFSKFLKEKGKNYLEENFTENVQNVIEQSVDIVGQKIIGEDIDWSAEVGKTLKGALDTATVMAFLQTGSGTIDAVHQFINNRKLQPPSSSPSLTTDVQKEIDSYVKENKGFDQDNASVEIVSRDEMEKRSKKGGLHSAEAVVLQSENGKDTILINEERVTPENINGILDHEYFGHRILFGNDGENGVLSVEDKDKIFSQAKTFADQGGFSQSMEDDYRERYSEDYRESGMSEAAISEKVDNLINIEIVNKWLQSEEFQSMKPDSPLADVVNRFIAWFKNLFKGQDKDVDISFEEAKRIIADVYGKYRKGQTEQLSENHESGAKQDVLFSIHNRSILPSDLPANARKVINNTSISAMKSDVDYTSAKHHGNYLGGLNIAEKGVKEEKVEQLKSQLSPDKKTYIIPVTNFENSEELNTIPFATANILARKIGGEVWIKFTKDSSTHLTNSSGFERRNADHIYRGDLPSGNNQFVIVDDTFTSGSTIFPLLEEIIKSGNDIGGIFTLAQSRNSGEIAGNKEVMNKIIELANIKSDDIINTLTKMTGAEQRIFYNEIRNRKNISEQIVRSLLGTEKSEGITGENSEGNGSAGESSEETIRDDIRFSLKAVPDRFRQDIEDAIKFYEALDTADIQDYNYLDGEASLSDYIINDLVPPDKIPDLLEKFGGSIYADPEQVKVPGVLVFEDAGRDIISLWKGDTNVGDLVAARAKAYYKRMSQSKEFQELIKEAKAEYDARGIQTDPEKAQRVPTAAWFAKRAVDYMADSVDGRNEGLLLNDIFNRFLEYIRKIATRAGLLSQLVEEGKISKDMVDHLDRAVFQNTSAWHEAKEKISEKYKVAQPVNLLQNFYELLGSNHKYDVLGKREAANNYGVDYQSYLEMIKDKSIPDIYKHLLKKPTGSPGYGQHISHASTQVAPLFSLAGTDSDEQIRFALAEQQQNGVESSSPLAERIKADPLNADKFYEIISKKDQDLSSHSKLFKYIRQHKDVILDKFGKDEEDVFGSGASRFYYYHTPDNYNTLQDQVNLKLNDKSIVVTAKPISPMEIAENDLMPLIYGKADTTLKKELTNAYWGEKPAQFFNKDTGRGAIVFKSPNSPGKWQLSYFDTKGFSGHSVFDTREEAIDDALSNYKPIAENVLDTLAVTEEWKEGTKKTKLAQLWNNLFSYGLKDEARKLNNVFSENGTDQALEYYLEELKPLVDEKKNTDNNARFSLAETAGLTKEQEADAETRQLAENEWKEKGTDSKFFKKWFSDSKVVDDSGKPKVVYHGTASDIKEFIPEFTNAEGAVEDKYDINKTGAFYFTSDNFAAREYAVKRGKTKTIKDANGKIRWVSGFGANIMPVYLNIKNPMVVDFNGKFKDRNFNSQILKARRNGNDGLIIKNVVDLPGGTSDLYNIEEGDGFESDVYIAFSPDQIKSSIGNIGTFGQVPIEGEDVRNDIRFSLTETKNKYNESPTYLEIKNRFPNFWTNQESDNIDSTQRSNTQATMKKISAYLQNKYGDEKKNVLDVSTGLGINANVLDENPNWDVSATEPNINDKKFEFDKNRTTKYSSDIKGHNKYDIITNTAVLNVLPGDIRDAVVSDIGRLLAPNGTAVITTRLATETDVLGAMKNKNNKKISDSEVYIERDGAFQKGFDKTGKELETYVQSLLDGEYGKGVFNVINQKSVNDFKNIPTQSVVIVTKNRPTGNTNARFSLSEPTEFDRDRHIDNLQKQIDSIDYILKNRDDKYMQVVKSALQKEIEVLKRKSPSPEKLLDIDRESPVGSVTYTMKQWYAEKERIAKRAAKSAVKQTQGEIDSLTRIAIETIKSMNLTQKEKLEAIQKIRAAKGSLKNIEAMSKRYDRIIDKAYDLVAKNTVNEMEAAQRPLKDETVSFSQYIRDRFKVREAGQRAGRKETVENVGGFVKMLTDYLREIKAPTPVKGRVLQGVNRLIRKGGYKADQTSRIEVLDELTDRADELLSSHNFGSARTALLKTLKKTKFWKLPTEFQDVILPVIENIPVLVRDGDANINGVNELADLIEKIDGDEVDTDMIASLRAASGKSFNTLTPEQLEYIRNAVKILDRHASKQRFLEIQNRLIDKSELKEQMKQGATVLGSPKFAKEKGRDPLDRQHGVIRKILLDKQRLPKNMAKLIDGDTNGGVMTGLLVDNLNKAESKAIKTRNEIDEAYYSRLREKGLNEKLPSILSKSEYLNQYSDLFSNINASEDGKTILGATKRTKLELENGAEIEIPPALAMTVYAYAKQQGVDSLQDLYAKLDELKNVPREELPDGLKFLTSESGFAFDTRKTGVVNELKKSVGLSGYKGRQEYSGQQLSINDIKSIIGTLSSEDLIIADAIHSTLNNEMHDILFDKFEKERGYPPASVDGYYMPQARLNYFDPKDKDGSSNPQLVEETPYNQRSMNGWGHFQGRSQGADSMAYIKDIFKIYDEHARFTGNYEGYVTPLRQLNDYLKDREVKKIVTDNFGSDLYNDLVQKVKNIQGGVINSANDPFSGLIGKLRANISKAVLPLNILGAIPKQTLSYVWSWKDTSRNPLDTLKRITLGYSQIARRALTPDNLLSKYEKTILDSVDSHDAQIASRRKGGYANKNIADIAHNSELIKTLTGKTNIDDKLFGLIRKTDRATMTQIAIDGFERARKELGVSAYKFRNNQLESADHNKLMDLATKYIWDAYSSGQPLTGSKDTGLFTDDKDSVVRLFDSFRTAWAQGYGRIIDEVLDARINAAKSDSPTGKTVAYAKGGKNIVIPMIAMTALSIIMKDVASWVKSRNEDDDEEKSLDERLAEYVKKYPDKFAKELPSHIASYELMSSQVIPDIIRISGEIEKGKAWDYIKRNKVFNSPVMEAGEDIIRVGAESYILIKDIINSNDLPEREKDRIVSDLAYKFPQVLGVIAGKPVKAVAFDFPRIVNGKSKSAIELDKRLENLDKLMKNMETDNMSQKRNEKQQPTKSAVIKDESILKHFNDIENMLNAVSLADNQINPEQEFIAPVKTEHSEDVKKKANELIRIKNKISDLVNIFGIKKKELEPEAKNGPIETAKGTVFQVEGGVSSVTNKQKMIQVLVSKLKMSPSTAKALLQQGQTPKFINPYLKVVPRNKPVKLGNLQSTQV